MLGRWRLYFYAEVNIHPNKLLFLPLMMMILLFLTPIIQLVVCYLILTCLNFSYNDDGDLEVGPWRDSILKDLHRRKEEQQKKFAYPSALESTSSSWSKSVKAHMFLVSKKSGWSLGQLELSNNDTLVFHRVSSLDVDFITWGKGMG